MFLDRPEPRSTQQFATPAGLCMGSAIIWMTVVTKAYSLCHSGNCSYTGPYTLELVCGDV